MTYWTQRANGTDLQSAEYFSSQKFLPNLCSHYLSCDTLVHSHLPRFVVAVMTLVMVMMDALTAPMPSLPATRSLFVSARRMFSVTTSHEPS